MRATGHSWQSGLTRRNATRSGCGRGRRSLVTNSSPPALVAATTCTPLMQHFSNMEVGLEDRSLTGWGKTTRRPRRQSCPAAMITLLQKSENDYSNEHDFVKVSEKLAKVLSDVGIRLLMCNMLQKTGAKMAEKEAKREEKLLIMQLERNKKEIEKKKKKKVDRELQKEKLQNDFLRTREVGEFLSGALSGAMTKTVLAPLETIRLLFINGGHRDVCFSS